MRTPELFRFVRERYLIYLRRQRGEPWPWTEDPILRQYRFTNVYREDDKVTRWIAKNWREPNATDVDLWFAMVVARLLNLPASLIALGYPVPFNLRRFKGLFKVRKLDGLRIFGAAYMVRADAVRTGLKTDYLADYVLAPLWDAADYVRPRPGDSLAGFHSRLMEYRDMGSFIAAQVVADVKNTEGQPLAEARDWWRWAASGPGSRRGLNRLLGLDVNARWKEEEWLQCLLLAREHFQPCLRQAHMPRICAQDFQNCLCEFDKYERVRLGEGRPKQLYRQEKENCVGKAEEG